MSQSKKIKDLQSQGISSNTLSTLSESQINSLYSRLLEYKKTEAKEVMTKQVKQSETYTMPVSDMQNKPVAIPTSTTGQPMTAQIKGSNVEFTTNEGEMKEDEDEEFNAMVTGIDQDKIQEPGSDYPGSDRSKDTLDEKFESKAQQGLFWARCNKCKSENCKWCKMAKEFSKSTTKKEYKDMPEKIHPEKTVKYKKKETKEGYLENVGKKVTDTYAKKFAAFTPGLAWGGLEESLDDIIEKHTQPTMTKGDLLKLIEQAVKPAPTVKPSTKPKPREDDPFKPKPGVKPKPKAKKDEETYPQWLSFENLTDKL